MLVRTSRDSRILRGGRLKCRDGDDEISLVPSLSGREQTKQVVALGLEEFSLPVMMPN